VAELVVLGTAQDGGVPHAGCLCVNCSAARSDYTMRRLPASIGLVDGDEWALIDATSAFAEQLHRLWLRRASSVNHQAERYPPPDTIVLTHAHTGHYTGLWQLDRSVLAARRVRVLAPPLMVPFLAANEPWATMVTEGFIAIEPLPLAEPFNITRSLTIRAEVVPHRAEWPSETVALFVQGPTRCALYIPDIDRWDEWEYDVVAAVSEVDVALLDGTFWDRPTSPIVPHPPILETMDRLQHLADAGRTRIDFSHCNHSNPALTYGSDAACEIERRGFAVAAEGAVYNL
jgi:pyrroloquinoline quinone biosynthesis protein B